MARLERIIERLDLKEFQLRSLLDVTKAINSNVSHQELLQLYERIVKDELGITRLLLYENIGSWERVLGYGHAGDLPELDVEQLFKEYTDIQVIGSGSAGSLGAFDVAVPVFHRDRPLAFLLIGDIDEEEQKMSPTVKHLNFIQTLTNLIVVAMENKRLARQELLQERAKRELELAAEMQSMLVPRDLPHTERFEAAAWYQPHSQVGGDYYDLIVLNEDEVVLCVADVSGKGIAAALLMSNFQANIRAMAQRAGTDMQRLVHDLNDRVFTNARGERFITLFLGHIDLRSRKMTYVNAGHNAPLVHQGGRVTPLHDGSIAMGMLQELPFLKVGHAVMGPGTTLLCYTDGLVEQEDEHGKEFGTEPLERVLRDLSSASASSINDALISDFGSHRGGQPYLDDIALLTCCIR